MSVSRKIDLRLEVGGSAEYVPKAGESVTVERREGAVVALVDGKCIGLLPKDASPCLEGAGMRGRVQTVRRSQDGGALVDVRFQPAPEAPAPATGADWPCEALPVGGMGRAGP